jgi:hypothetical protein
MQVLMKCVVLRAVILLLIFAPCVVRAEQAGTLEDFSVVKFEHGALVVVNQPHGEKFMARIGDTSELRTLMAGARAVLPLGQLSFFYVKHRAVSFVPLQGKRGFLVRKSSDRRATGGGLTAEEFELSIGPDGTLTYGLSKPVEENGPKAY